MAQQHINYSQPNDRQGDSLRASQVKSESNFNELYTNKVDKIAGQGLSETNFTQIEKDKLANIGEGGQLQTDWNQGDNTKKDYLKNKITNVSQLFNDAEYIGDVEAVGVFARSAGAWVDLGIKPEPILKTALTTGVGQTFELPIGFKAGSVLKSRGEIFKGSEWSQTSNILTIIINANTGNSIYIKPE